MDVMDKSALETWQKVLLRRLKTPYRAAFISGTEVGRASKAQEVLSEVAQAVMGPEYQAQLSTPPTSTMPTLCVLEVGSTYTFSLLNAAAQDFVMARAEGTRLSDDELHLNCVQAYGGGR